MRRSRDREPLGAPLPSPAQAAVAAMSSSFLAFSSFWVAFFLSTQPVARRSRTSWSRKRVRLGSCLSLASDFTLAKTPSNAAWYVQPGPSNSGPATVSKFASDSNVPGEGSANSSSAQAMSTFEAKILFAKSWPTNLAVPMTRVCVLRRFSSSSWASSGGMMSSFCFFFFFSSASAGCRLASKEAWHWSSRMRLKLPTLACFTDQSLR
mmetsp:Transcript_56091/g.150121  ORF Transcript_56091/g.150121 Transcript_56091/m.150121 type:complete len:208 (-) Transcript_56091:102-725(-)